MAGLGVSVVIGLLARELATGQLQSTLISNYAADIDYWMEEGANPLLRFADAGPYDKRHGYSELPVVLSRLRDNGFHVTAQARTSERFEEVLDLGAFPIYDEKPQAGLEIQDRRGPFCQHA